MHDICEIFWIFISVPFFSSFLPMGTYNLFSRCGIPAFRSGSVMRLLFIYHRRVISLFLGLSTIVLRGIQYVYVGSWMQTTVYV